VAENVVGAVIFCVVNFEIFLEINFLQKKKNKKKILNLVTILKIP
jgi:hypothetical protein